MRLFSAASVLFMILVIPAFALQGTSYTITDLQMIGDEGVTFHPNNTCKTDANPFNAGPEQLTLYGIPMGTSVYYIVKLGNQPGNAYKGYFYAGLIGSGDPFALKGAFKAGVGSGNWYIDSLDSGTGYFEFFDTHNLCRSNQSAYYSWGTISFTPPNPGTFTYSILTMQSKNFTPNYTCDKYFHDYHPAGNPNWCWELGSAPGLQNFPITYYSVMSVFIVPTWNCVVEGGMSPIFVDYGQISSLNIFTNAEQNFTYNYGDTYRYLGTP